MIENSKLLRMLFFAGIVMIPFDGMPGLGVIGELAHEGSFYFFFPALLYAIILVIGSMLERSYSPPAGARWILICALVFLGCILLSGLINLPDIAEARFHKRTGLPKFVTSFGVIVYGFGLAWLTITVVNGKWYERLVVPACISAAICIVVALLERANQAGLNFPPFQAFYSFIHAGTEGPAVLWDGSLNLKVLEGWDKRLRSVSFEPPAFGNFAGLIWPWLACGCLMAPQSRKTMHVALLIAFTILIIVAQARTGWLLLACGIATFLTLRFAFYTGHGKPGLAWGVIPAGLVALLVGGVWYGYAYDDLVKGVVNGDSISDLTRFAYQVTAFKIFADDPVFGVGLGQFAFTALDYMPNWGLLSSEIRASFTFPEAPWPNTYSIYARTSAEVGLVGLFAWLGVWLGTFVSVYAAGLAKEREGAPIPWAYFATLMTTTALFASWVTSDTYRTALIWVTLGAGAHIIGLRKAGAASTI